jgi:hypothetical protein
MSCCRRLPLSLLCGLLANLLFASVGLAQEEEPLSLRLDKRLGYAMGQEIQGQFQLEVVGPEGLQRVTFVIDGHEIGTVREPPFETAFSTDDYGPGEHELWAQARAKDGRTLRSQRHKLVFLSPEQARGRAMRVLLPLLGGVLLLTLIGALGSSLLAREKRAFELGAYGPAGGAVCPRCKLPYARPLLAPNLLLGKLARCPHCGKWAVTPRAPASALRQAEDRYRTQEEGAQGLRHNREEDLPRLLEESRFED